MYIINDNNNAARVNLSRSEINTFFDVDIVSPQYFDHYMMTNIVFNKSKDNGK